MPCTTTIKATGGGGSFPDRRLWARFRQRWPRRLELRPLGQRWPPAAGV